MIPAVFRNLDLRSALIGAAIGMLVELIYLVSMGMMA